MEHDEQIVAAVRDSSDRSLSLVNDEIKALVAEIEPPPGTFTHREEADFWLELPRTFSFTSARFDQAEISKRLKMKDNMNIRFELPLDMNTLVGMEPVDFLARHVTVTTSRRQLYDKVNLRYRASHENFKHFLLTGVHKK